MRPKTRLGGHGAAGPRSTKRSTNSRKRLTSACQVVGRVARNSGGLRPFPFGQGITWIANQLSGDPRDPRGRRGLQLPKTVPQIAAHMADHLWRRETPPERLAIRCQAGDPVEDGISGLGVKE